MAIYITGRERVIEMEGDFSGDHSSKWECVPNPPFTIPPSSTQLTTYKKPSWAVGALGVEFSAFGGEGGSLSTDCTPSSGNVSSNLDAAITGISSFTVGDVMTDSDHHVDSTFTRPGNFSRTLTGSWLASCLFQEIAVITLVTESDAFGFPEQPIPDGSHFVSFGDSNLGGLIGYYVTFFERAKIGSTLHGEAVLGGASVAVDCQITADNQFLLVHTFGFGIDYGIRLVAHFETKNTTGSASVSGYFQGTQLGAPYSVSSAVASADANGPVVASVDVGSSTTARYSECSVALFPPMVYLVDGRARIFDTDYPGPIDAAWVYKIDNSLNLVSRTFTMNPDGSDSYDQLRYGCSADLNGTAATGALKDEWVGIRAWMEDSSLSANGEDPDDWRLQAQVWPWGPAFTIAQDASKKAANGATVTDSSTDITLIETNLEGYRYLEFTQSLAGASTKNLALTIGTKEYAFVATDAGSTIQIDLCAPSNLPAGFKRDERDGRYPLTSGVTGPDQGEGDVTGPAKDAGWEFGVLEHPAHVSITGLASGESCAIGDLILIRVSTDGELSVLLPHQNEQLGWTSPTDNTYLDFDISQMSDGKQVGPWPARAHVVPTTADPDYYVWYSIAQMEGFLSFAPGWTYTAGTPATYPYLDGSPTTKLLSDSLEAGHLDGFVWDGSDFVNQVAIPPGGLSLAFKVDVLEGYPGCGDVTQAYGALTDPVPFRFSKLLRCQSEGICLNIDGSVNSGAEVVLHQTSDQGADTADSLGVYRTGDPFGVGAYAGSRTYLTAKSSNFESFRSANRYRHRTSFRFTLGGGLAYGLGRNLRHGIASSEDGMMSLGFSSNSVLDFSDVMTSAQAEALDADYNRGTGFNALWIAYGSAGTVYLASAISEDGTISMATTLGDGDYGTPCFTPNNTLFTFRLDPSGTVYGRSWDSNLNPIEAEWACTGDLTGLDNAQISARATVQSNSLLIVMLYRKAGALAFSTSPDGKAFS